MLEGLLLLALKKAGAKIGEEVSKKVQEALFGHETTLDDLKDMISGVEHSIKGLPEEVVHYMVKIKFIQTLSQVEHDCQNANIAALLRFLGEDVQGSRDKLYFWGLANLLCIEMTGVSATEFENYREAPSKIDFAKRAYVQKINGDLLRKTRPITNYVDGVSDLIVMLSVSIVAIQHMASEALKKIAEVKSSDPLYERCQKLLNNAYTKKYLPFDGDKVGGNGLSAILSPALTQCPRSVVGVELAGIYESASAGTTPRLSFMSHRYRSSSRRYLQWEGSKNPWTSSDSTKNWRLSFTGSARERITISHYPSRSGSDGLYIGFPAFSHDMKDYGIWVGEGSSSWYWFIKKEKNDVVHMFRNGSGSMLAQVLSTNSNFRNFFQHGKGLNFRAYMVLKS